MDVHALAKTFIIVGMCIIVTGFIMLVAPKIPFLGKLPGDIYIKKENFSFYFPLATSLIVSAILSLILWLFSRR